MPTAQPAGRIATLNDTQIYFEVYGSGEPVLLLHGFSGSSQDWTKLVNAWSGQFQLIIPDLRGHGRSSILLKAFRHQDAALDMLALLDYLRLGACKGVGVSAGGNVLLHLATMQPDRIRAMVLVSATPYYPAQARPRSCATMRSASRSSIGRSLRRAHPGGNAQIKALLASTGAFADSYDDLSFTPPHLATIKARTLIVQGDRDPFYPVELSVEMAKAIPHSSLWVMPNAGHAPIGGERWSEFVKAAETFLRA